MIGTPASYLIRMSRLFPAVLGRYLRRYLPTGVDALSNSNYLSTYGPTNFDDGKAIYR